MEKNASQLIDDMAAKLTDWRGPVFANVRRIIRDADPDIVEEWKWMGSPVWSRDGIICVGNAFKDKIKVTFDQGAHFADPDKLFNSGLEGNQRRSIDIFKDGKINETSLKNLVRAAVAFNQSKVKAGKKKTSG